MNASIPVERCKDFGSFKRRFVNSRALQEKIPQKISQLLGTLCAQRGGIDCHGVGTYLADDVAKYGTVSQRSPYKAGAFVPALVPASKEYDAVLTTTHSFVQDVQLCVNDGTGATGGMCVDGSGSTVNKNSNPSYFPGFTDGTPDLGNPLTTSNDAPDKSRIRFLGVSGGVFLKMLFWKITFFRKSLLPGIDVLKKTFLRSRSRCRLSHTFHCIFADG